jgi:parvulin-like peptidyl-prolyl isomerase
MRTCMIFTALLAAVPAVNAQEPGGAYAVVQGPAGPIKAALFSEEYAALPIARVEDRVVTLQDLSDALSAAHEARLGSAPQAGKKDFAPVLERLIGMKLIVLEAHEMGIDGLPDIREEMERYEKASLREVLKERISKGVEADPGEVEAAWKNGVREWKVTSVFLPAEEDARALVASVKSGQSWDQAVKGAIAAKKIKGGEESQLISRKLKALPPVLEAVEPLKVGEVAGPVRLEKGFAVLKLQEIRHPEDPAAKLEAEEWSKARRQTAAVYDFYKQLLKTQVKVDEKLLKSLDFEKKPGFAALSKDRRALARIQGAAPVTVADLSGAIGDEFFHGITRAIQEKKVNARKIPVFENLVYQRLFDAEARRLGIPQSAPYRKMVGDHRDALVFGKFVEKAILPDVRVTEGDVKKYYDEHAAQFSYPAFYTISSIAFERQKAAQAAYEKLKAGTDFKWLKANADGQLAEAKRAIEFDGSTVSARAIPPDLGRLLANAKSGDLRLYASQEGGHYVIQVKAVTPPSPLPYVEAREQIAPRIQQQKINQSLEEWVAKLRKAREVKVYITQISS